MLYSLELWKLYTPVFLHYSPANLLIDTFVFLYFAPKIEYVFGPWRFLVLLLLLPPFAIVFSLCLNPNENSFVV